MTIDRFRVIFVATWFVILVLIAARVAITGVTLGLGVTTLVLACTAVAVFLIVFRGGPPATIAQVLHTTKRTGPQERSNEFSRNAAAGSTRLARRAGIQASRSWRR